MFRLLGLMTLVVTFIACEQDPELTEQQPIDQQVAVPEGTENPEDNLDADANPEEELEAEVEDEGEPPVEEEVPPPTFADFNALALIHCGDCHGAGSGRTYLVNDEANATTNKAIFLDRISNAAMPMPQSGLLSAEIQAEFKAYLDTVQ
ncbi:MAG: hypothetical protein HRU19_28470 [Pseudobacteriovorax sp.]|nr:hypothetical protein [Pseudobacteriovorax sp.]